MGTNRPLNLDDVAKLAGVSRSTVSRVVNDDPRVSDEVRQRVREMITAVGYQPNAAARALASRRSGIIGMVIPEDFGSVYVDPWFPPLIQACVRAAKLIDRSVMLVMFSMDDPDDVETLMRRFVRPRTVDGLIISNSIVDDVLAAELRAANFPYIVIGYPAHEGHSFVDISNRDAARDVTRHLLSHGRTRPAMINGPEWVISARNRREGFMDAVREMGLDPDAAPVLAGDFTTDAGYAAGNQLLTSDERPDCVFAASDAIAIGVMDSARELDITIPEELAIAGFDDIMAHRNEQIGLTSVLQPVDDMGREAVMRLDQLIHQRIEPPVEVWLETSLRIRRSCGCDVPLGTPDEGAGRKEDAVAPA